MNELRKLIVWLIFTFIQSYSISTNGWDTNYSKAGNVKFKRASLMNNPFVNMMMQMIAPSLNTPPTENFLDIFRDYYPLPNGLKSPYSEYDYVIVGAGSAGSVLAARLTEDPNVTVLLIEAGRPEHFFTDAPAISPYFQLTEYTWPYFMEPQKGVCLGMDNQRCFWPRGRAVGGTSVINYLIYTRGRPEEWDRIGVAGNQGWSYADVLPYYMKTEDAKLKGYENSPYRGRDGELNVNFIPTRTPLVEAFLEAGRTLGHTVVDYNDPEQLGFGYLQVTANLGRRVSAAKAFLHPNKFRPNLHILQESRVTKVLINKNDRSTYGVEFIRNYNKQGSIKQIVNARREVILSAGPIASPQLLMLSGIGPEEHLKSHGIPVIQNLPVGRTLYDHICFPGLIFTLNVTNVTFNENRQASLANVIRWTMFGDGPVSSAGGAEALGYIKTPGSTEPERVPDIELLSIGGSLVSDGGPSGSKAVRRGMNINNEVFDKAYGSIDNTDTWSSFLMLLHPKSVGYLELRSKNPFQFPRIYGNYLTDPSDVRTLIAGIRYVQALAETDAFKKFGAKLHRARYPTCKGLRFNSDAYWECAIRTLTATLHHQIATCRMGPPNDPLAVVDPELRVYGVSRLRVVDSSIIPRTTAAHTNAPAIMIGEKAADMIKNFWSI